MVSSTEVKTNSVDDLLVDGDWCIIFDKNGEPKGLFIPEGYTENDTPDTIVDLLKEVGIYVGKSVH
jgi:hypothetical protein